VPRDAFILQSQLNDAIMLPQAVLKFLMLPGRLPDDHRNGKQDCLQDQLIHYVLPSLRDPSHRGLNRAARHSFMLSAVRPAVFRTIAKGESSSATPARAARWPQTAGLRDSGTVK
jgi:hypothetical protein